MRGETMSHSVRMEKIQLVAMVFVFFGLLAVAIPLVCSQIIPKDEVQVFQAPGKAIVNFEGAGSYSIYYERFLDDEKYLHDVEEQALLYLAIEISKMGMAQAKPLVLTKAWEKHSYRQGRRKGISVFTFEVREAGDYGVKAYYRSGNGPALRMALGQVAENSDGIRLAIIIMIAVVGAVSVLTLFIFAIKILGS